MKGFLRNTNALSTVAATILIIILAVAAMLLILAFMGIIAPKYEPRLDLRVSPPGYPEIGSFWSIIVFKVNFNEGRSVYSHAENATVIVGVLTKTNMVETYQFLTDSEGKASFQYLEKYSEVRFQSFLDGYKPSDEIVLNQRYVSQDTLTWLSSFSGTCLALALGSGSYLGRKKKSSFNKILNWTLLCIMSISSFILIFVIYSFLFKGTSWGFPSEIIASVVTFETLKRLAFVTVFLYVFAAFLFYINFTKQNENRKLSKDNEQKPTREKTSKSK
jgi:hypothetical protein